MSYVVVAVRQHCRYPTASDPTNGNEVPVGQRLGHNFVRVAFPLTFGAPLIDPLQHLKLRLAQGSILSRLGIIQRHKVVAG